MTSYVYLITNGDLTKIGVSDNPQKRLKDIQTSNPKILTLAYVITCHEQTSAFWAESLLHKRYNDYRVSGEWFNIPCEKIIKDISWSLDLATAVIKSDRHKEIEKSRKKRYTNKLNPFSKYELAKEWLKEHPEDTKLTGRELSEQVKPHGVYISHVTWNKAKTEV